MFTFLHAADIHLDSPLVGLERYGDAPLHDLRGATRRAFENLVALAVEEQVAFVVLAGDLYDGEWRDYNTGLFFASQMSRLKDAGIMVFIVAGNHDAANPFTKSLRTPDNVVRFHTGHAETRYVKGHDVAIHGRGFASRCVEEDLSASYPPFDSACFNVGLLHTSLDGREGHASYAPCSLDGLRSRHYQYWALGHVHVREVVSRDPWVVFPGNTQGRHARETGAKGCSLVTVDGREVVRVEEKALDVVRWSRCVVGVSGAASGDEVLDRVGRALEGEVARAEGRTLAVRMELQGATSAHAELMAHPEKWEQELRALALDRHGQDVWLEKVRFGTSGLTTAHPEGVDEALGGLLRTLQDEEYDHITVTELAREFSDLRAKLPAELLDPDAPEPLDPTSPDQLREVLRQARELLVARMTTDGK